MIFGLKADKDPILDLFVERFRSPPSMSMALLHASVYVENKVDWVDDVLVFRQKSIVDGFAKFGIVSSVGMMLLALFLQSMALLQVGFLLALLCMASISPLIRFIAIRLKLFMMGYRGKCKMVSKDFLLEKLFFKLEM